MVGGQIHKLHLYFFKLPVKMVAGFYVPERDIPEHYYLIINPLDVKTLGQIIPDRCVPTLHQEGLTLCFCYESSNRFYARSTFLVILEYHNVLSFSLFNNKAQVYWRLDPVKVLKFFRGIDRGIVRS
jgi:hypothetical protein